MTPQPAPPPLNGHAGTAPGAVHPLHRPEPGPAGAPATHALKRPLLRYPLVSQLTPLGALPTAPGCARAHVRDTLQQWGLPDFQEAAELLISEMVTNAVQASTDEHGHPVYVHGRLPVIIVRLQATPDGVVLEVWDLMPGAPVLRNLGPWDARGRGLFLLQALAHKWDWTTTPGWPGKCVWAQLRQPLPAT